MKNLQMKTKTVILVLLVVATLIVGLPTAYAAEFKLPLENGVIITHYEEGGLMIQSDSSNSVIATESGTIKVYNDTTIAIDHDGSIRTIYYNLDPDSIAVFKDQGIEKGYKLGEVNSGKLYLEVRKYNKELDTFCMLNAAEYINTGTSVLTENEVEIQPVNYTPTSEEFDFYCRVIMGEIGGFTGSSEDEDERLVRVAVAESMLNRVESKFYPNTLDKVLKQRKQYSCINKSWFEDRGYTDEVVQVAKAALAGESPTYHEIVGGATSYYYPVASDANAGGWMQRNLICTSIYGVHIFGNFKDELQNQGIDLSNTVTDQYGNIWYDQTTLDKWEDKLNERYHD